MSFPKIRIRQALWAIAICISVLVFAQEPVTIKVNVSVVNVLATVRDNKGHIVNNLTKDDFILEEEGKQQEIQYFSRQTDLPLTIGLLIDTSMSQVRLIEDERSASYQFLDQVLRPERDQAFVIKFDFDAVLLQDLTKSRPELLKALNALQAPLRLRRSESEPASPIRPDVVFVQLPRGIPGGGPGGRVIRGWPSIGNSNPFPGAQQQIKGIGTVLYDAVYLASEEILRKREGRKTIMLISDGVDNGSTVTEKDATDAAHRADALIYSIRYYDASAYPNMGTGTEGAWALKALSQQTGGRMFEVTKKLALKDIYDQIQEELRSQYNIGYTPSYAGGTKFRRIKLATKDKKLKVVARSGYYPKQS
jgi:VWFA-related protein